jgi:hypothetical protein
VQESDTGVQKKTGVCSSYRFLSDSYFSKKGCYS